LIKREEKLFNSSLEKWRRWELGGKTPHPHHHMD
jgi:hypothetical protein